MKRLMTGMIALALCLGGCTYRVADMTIASTKNYNINSAKFIKGGRVKGEDTAPVFLFPLGIPNVKTAADNAIERDKCAVALSDVVVTQLNQAFLVGVIGFRVEGTQVIDTSQPNCENWQQTAKGIIW